MREEGSLFHVYSNKYISRVAAVSSYLRDGCIAVEGKALESNDIRPTETASVRIEGDPDRPLYFEETFRIVPVLNPDNLDSPTEVQRKMYRAAGEGIILPHRDEFRDVRGGERVVLNTMAERGKRILGRVALEEIRRYSS